MATTFQKLMAMDISKLQAHVVIQCIAYYEMDGDTLIGDWGYKAFSDVLYARQLDEYICYDELIASTRLGYATYDHDRSTGYTLMQKLKDEDRQTLTETAKILLDAKALKSNGELNKIHGRSILDRMKCLKDKGLWLI